MAVPTVVGVGAIAGAPGAGPVTVPFPSAYTPVANDVAVVFAECNETDVYGTPSGWAHVTGSPLVVTGGGTRLNEFWIRFAGGESAPALSLTTGADHIAARMVVVRGVKTSGNPWNAVGTGTEATSDTSATWPGVTTTVNDCLMLEAIATGTDLATTANLGALTNGAYTNIVEQVDNWLAANGGGGIGVVSATMSTAGATGASTATLANAAPKALMTLALEPDAGGGGTPWTQSVSDTMSITDTPTVGGHQLVNDTATVADTSARKLVKTVAEALSVTDTGVEKTVVYTVADTGTVADHITLPGVQNWTQAVNDTLTVTAAMVKTARPKVADTATLTDSVVLPGAHRWEMDVETRWPPVVVV